MHVHCPDIGLNPHLSPNCRFLEQCWGWQLCHNVGYDFCQPAARTHTHTDTHTPVYGRESRFERSYDRQETENTDLDLCGLWNVDTWCERLKGKEPGSWNATDEDIFRSHPQKREAKESGLCLPTKAAGSRMQTCASKTSETHQQAAMTGRQWQSPATQFRTEHIKRREAVRGAKNISNDAVAADLERFHKPNRAHGKSTVHIWNVQTKSS